MLQTAPDEFWVAFRIHMYGKDFRSNFAELLKALDGVGGDFKIRVGMMIPNMVTDMQEELIDAFKSGKVFKFLHLPVQSGDDETLNRMRRFYTVAEFKAIVDAFRARFPDLTLATDVMVGLPGETEVALKNA